MVQLDCLGTNQRDGQICRDTGEMNEALNSQSFEIDRFNFQVKTIESTGRANREKRRRAPV